MKFIAIPVGRGDAFYLEKNDTKILVDGGSGKKTSLPYFKSTAIPSA